MTDKQPEALRLADELDARRDWYEFDPSAWCPQAAAELRRLHELNEDKTEIIDALSATLAAQQAALRERLAQPESMTPSELAKRIKRGEKWMLEQQEPVAWRTFDGEGGYDYRAYDMNENYANEWAQRNPRHKGWVEPLYTAPPRREWVGLTDEEISALWASHTMTGAEITRAIEARLKEKNA